MSSGKKVLIGLLSFLLFITVTNGLALAAIARVATNREQVKLVLANKAVYSAATKALLNTQQSSSAESTEQNVDTEALQKIIDKYFTTETFNKAVNGVIDSTYDWLEGKTQQPKFNITFAANQAEFQQFITQVFTDRFNALPPCEEEIDLTTYNPIEASCKPEGYSAADVQTFINDQSSTPELAEFYKNASINSNLVFGEISPKTTDQIRGNYNLLKVVPFLVWGIIIVLNGLIILVAMNWRRGLKIASIATLVPSVLALVSAVAISVVFSAIIQALFQSNASLTAADVKSILNPFAQAVTNKVLIYSAALSTISLLTLLGTIFIKPKPSQPLEANPSIPKEPSSAEPTTKEQKP